MCPNEKNPPDNWSFLEKFLNAVEFSASSKFHENAEIGKEVRKGVVNELLGKLLESIKNKKIGNPSLGIWVGGDTGDFSGNRYRTAKLKTAEFICQKKFHIGEK